MFEVGDLVRVTEAASSLGYAGLIGTVRLVEKGGRRGENYAVTVHLTDVSEAPNQGKAFYVGQSLVFWSDLYPLELVNNEPPVCEDWS